jgi:Uma2 family endonuclease
MTELTYPIAELFPPQGQWAEADYLALETNKLIELADGRLEVLEMPSYFHQVVVGRLFLALALFFKQHVLGRVCIAPLRVKLSPGRFREPDVMVMLSAHLSRIHSKHWDAPDLVVEVVSPDDPDRDYVTKKKEYAEAGIPEYWIVDPDVHLVEVYTLPPNTTEYQLPATYRDRDVLTSRQ